MQTLEQLQQENQQLKKELEALRADYEALSESGDRLFVRMIGPHYAKALGIKAKPLVINVGAKRIPC